MPGLCREHVSVARDFSFSTINSLSLVLLIATGLLLRRYLGPYLSGIWVALDGTYFSGGRTKLNGVQNDTLQSNTRGGVTLAIPVDRNNSIKLYAFGGTTTRTGTTANSAGVAWQYRWGGGY